jgi:hypothetical protein
VLAWKNSLTNPLRGCDKAVRTCLSIEVIQKFTV